MKTKQSSSSMSYKRRVVLAIQAGIALGLAFALSLRAIDTGSLQQYVFVLIFLSIGIFKLLLWIRQGKQTL